MIKIIAKNVNRSFAKLRGLMFVESIKPIYFETRFGIHTFFFKAPIAVLVLDDKNVVCHKKIVKPWRVFFWNPKFKKVLELPVDYKTLKKIKVGDKVVVSS